MAFDPKEKAYYQEYHNDYYNPDDNEKHPGVNENWKMIQKGFHESSETDEDQNTDISGLKTRMTAAETAISSIEYRKKMTRLKGLRVTLEHVTGVKGDILPIDSSGHVLDNLIANKEFNFCAAGYRLGTVTSNKFAVIPQFELSNLTSDENGEIALPPLRGFVILNQGYTDETIEFIVLCLAVEV